MFFNSLDIIYEDEDFVALNKPAGVNFDWARDARPDLIPAHRLDKDTSGIILFAKNQTIYEKFKVLFQTRQIQKTYVTLVVGLVKNNSGVIDLPIGRSKKTPLKRVAIGAQRGKIREAVTDYKVLKRFDLSNRKFTLLEAYPKTGRTHQIRSHLAAIGYPVVCDKLYAGKKFVCPGNLSRQFLHAKSLEFDPPNGGRLMLEADLPEDLENTLNSLL